MPLPIHDGTGSSKFGSPGGRKATSGTTSGSSTPNQVEGEVDANPSGVG